MRHRIYIAGPMGQGDKVANIAKALAAFRDLIDLGFAPLCPHLTAFAESMIPCSHTTWLSIDLPWVSVAEAVLRLPGVSLGAEMEQEAAIASGVPVFFDLPSLIKHFRNEAP